MITLRAGWLPIHFFCVFCFIIFSLHNKVLYIYRNSLREDIVLLEKQPMNRTYRFILEPSLERCDPLTNGIVLVHSVPDDIHRRQLIRQTWGNLMEQQRSSTLVIFVTGIFTSSDPGYDFSQESIVLENKLHNDILQVDMIDSYYNVTLKHIAWMQWLLEHKKCKPRFVLKADSDTMVFLHELTLYFTSSTNNQLSINGLCWDWRKPSRRKNNDWFIPYSYYPESKLPLFCSGCSIIFRLPAISKLYAQALKETKYFYIDDLLFSGILADKARLVRFHEPRMCVKPWDIDAGQYPLTLNFDIYWPSIMQFWKTGKLIY